MWYVANIITRVYRSSIITRNNTGTPLYSSPEEFKDGEKIAMMPADMWSLGVRVFFFLLKIIIDETTT